MHKIKTVSKVVAATHTMKVGEYSCTFNMPRALESRLDSEGKEVVQGLPPGAPQAAYAVDEFPECPDNWMHGSAKASSYFLAIEEGKGMWLDFNGNHPDSANYNNGNRNNKHDVAVVVSVQGINSVTGQKTTAMTLEQYKTKCPIHDVEFQQERFCPECKYKWPAQNYLATTGTPSGLFWLDGFRNAQGQVRQYVFTADEAKGVAAKKIGNDRVFAIGIAFYRSKKPKPQPTYSPSHLRTVTCSVGGGGGGGAMYKSIAPMAPAATWTGSKGGLESTMDLLDDVDAGPMLSAAPSVYYSDVITEKQSVNYSADNIPMATTARAFAVKETKTSSGILLKDTIPRDRTAEVHTMSGIRLPDAKPVEKKNYEVAAGARIDQEVYPDPESVDYWEDTPQGIIYINYANKEYVESILKAGTREEETDGFLSDVPVGHVKPSPQEAT